MSFVACMCGPSLPLPPPSRGASSGNQSFQPTALAEEEWAGLCTGKGGACVALRPFADASLFPAGDDSKPVWTPRPSWLSRSPVALMENERESHRSDCVQIRQKHASLQQTPCPCPSADGGFHLKKKNQNQKRHAVTPVSVARHLCSSLLAHPAVTHPNILFI